ncbi:Rv3235 family protein, partial [Streptomyces alkaliphilus]|uniref:Rv3235 family protein n=1 Tax=Streptomyces alkaliphilus TaxID=1472722 RepID=UPI001E55839A
RRPTPFPALVGLGSSRPRPDVVEAFARVAVPGRFHALAFRLGHRPRGWRCEAVDLGPLDPVAPGGRPGRVNPGGPGDHAGRRLPRPARTRCSR